MIYLFAPETDSHTLELAATRALEKHEIQYITADRFIQGGISISGGDIAIDGRQLTETDVLVYRRSLIFNQALSKLGYLGEEKDFIAGILRKHAESFLLACEHVCHVINPISKHCLAFSKPHQLNAARKFGLNTPATIVSNNIKDILTWIDGYKRLIIKPYSAGFELTGGRSGCVQAVEIKATDVQGFSFAESPMIVQELIQSSDEIRVLVRPGSLLGLSLGWSNRSSGVDWRPHQRQLEVTLLPLPTDLTRKIMRLCEYLGIGVGTIDLICREQEFWFLEANLAGNYQMPCPLPISPAEWVAEGLATLDGDNVDKISFTQFVADR